MKYLSVLFIVGLIGMVGCKETTSDNVKISVVSDKPAPENGLAILYSLEEGKMSSIDTMNVSEAGLELELVVTEPGFYALDMYRTQAVNFILDGSESSVEINIDGAQVSIEGSGQSSVVRSIDDLMAKSQRDMQQLSQEAGMANQQGDQETVEAIIEQYNNLQIKNEIKLKGIIREASPSLAAVYGLNYLDMDANFALFDSVASGTVTDLPDNFLVNDIMDRVDKARVLAVGQVAPEINLPNPEGVEVSLSSLRGKYVLIDFWAAWCKPCRAENPNVVRMYNKYGGDKFEIYGVSLDRTEAAWLKAIEDDGLMWKHVSDLAYFNSEAARLYAINAIPATYLIDPEGKIVAKNLRGPSLEAKLQELFDKES